jgi:hypothetical protein
MRGSTFRVAGWLAAAGLLGAALLAPTSALATKPAPEHQVTICHATDSDHLPYVRETVDIASSGYLKGGHNDHTGPIWNATLKPQHLKWGDIIPPYTYGTFSYAGLNWSTDGQAIWTDGCAIPAPVPSGSPSPSATESSSPQPEESGSPSPSGSASSQPSGSVEGESGTPAATPPTTDAVSATGPSESGSSWLLLAAALVSLTIAATLLAPARARRR